MIFHHSITSSLVLVKSAFISTLRLAPFIAHSLDNSGKICLKLVLASDLFNLSTFGFLRISQQWIDGFTQFKMDLFPYDIQKTFMEKFGT